MTTNPLLTPQSLTGHSDGSPLTAGERAAFSNMAAKSTMGNDLGGGPVADDRFTIGGVVQKAAIMVALLVAGGVVGWGQVAAPTEFEPAQIPGWIFLGFIGGIAAIFAANKMPHLAKFIAPLYSLLYGAVVGAISHIYEIQYEGIVLQAVVASIGVFVSMLFLYSSRIIRVTDRLRRGIMMATMGLMVVYGFQFVMNMLNVDLEVPFLHSSGPIGILVSVAIVGLAAFNLLTDFDMIERAERAGAPQQTEWLAAMGLVVTLVWLYMEILRLLGKTRR
jgi:uncharacterized YccA/Bax inhibitor family protein